MALINLDKHQKEHALLQLLQPEQTGDNLAAELAAISLRDQAFSMLSSLLQVAQFRLQRRREKLNSQGR
jgi:hypothetical protein